MSKLNTIGADTGEIAIKIIAERRSFARLEDPAPPSPLMDTILSASLRAPDHLGLKPWRFLTIQGEGRSALGDIFAKSVQQADPQADQDKLDKARSKPMRAPLIIVGITSPKVHEKVPEIEQVISTGTVMHNIGLALYANGFGSVWRTGGFAFCETVNQGLGLTGAESVCGFLYVGTPSKRDKTVKQLDMKDYFHAWP